MNKKSLIEHTLSLSVKDLVTNNIINSDFFSVYRKRYAAYLERFGVSLESLNEGYCFSDLEKNISFENFLKVTGENLENLISKHRIENLVMGISGDLDSSFNLLILSQIIKERKLPCKIIAYHFKNNFYPKRARRIEKLLRHVNKNFCQVIFFSYDISISSKLLSAEMDIFESENIRPKTKEKSEEINSILEELKSFNILNEDLFIKSKREKAPFIHELSMVIRGRILRKFPKSILIGSMNATELCVSNFTTSDLLVGFAPLCFLQKTLIRKMFKEIIVKSNGCLKITDWDFIFSNPTPFYPSGIKYSINKNRIFFQRNTNHFFFLESVSISLPKNLLINFCDTNPFRIPGEAQYIIDLYLFHFICFGFSNKEKDKLIRKNPSEKNFILLASFLYLTARELSVKDMYMANCIF